MFNYMYTTSASSSCSRRVVVPTRDFTHFVEPRFLEISRISLNRRFLQISRISRNLRFHGFSRYSRNRRFHEISGTSLNPIVQQM